MTVGADSALAGGQPVENGTDVLAAELFRRHSKLVLSVCRRLLRDPAEAEDAMQQTFVSAYRAILAGREPQQPEVWLAAIARNECLDRIRTRMRSPLAGQAVHGGPEAPDALATLIADEQLRALSGSIKDLPAQQREALLLHEFHGLPYGEVAAAMGVSESAIGSLLFRARRSLRSTFRRAYGVLPVPGAWNAVAQLIDRGPAIKVAALPVVAKLGCSAAAVGLTAGAVVAVEHEVGKQQAHRAVATHAAAPATPRSRTSTTGLLRDVAVERHAGVSGPAATARFVSAGPRNSTLSLRARRTSVKKATRPASGDHAVTAVAPPASSQAAPEQVRPSRSAEASASPPGQSHSNHATHASIRSDRIEHHGNGKALGKTKAVTRPAKQNAMSAKVPRGQARSSTARAKSAAASARPAQSGQAPDSTLPTEEQASVDTASADSAAADPEKEHPDHPEHPAHPDHPTKS